MFKTKTKTMKKENKNIIYIYIYIWIKNCHKIVIQTSFLIIQIRLSIVQKSL